MRRRSADGTLEGEFERADRAEITGKAREAEDAAKDEVWASYRYVVLADNRESDGLKVIDLGAGHASATETLSGRVVAALKSQALLNESPGASYLERRWPQAFKESGAWPLVSLRQAFLNGSMERLLDADSYLRNKIPEFVFRGDFGLASGKQPDGTYSRVWFGEPLPVDEVAFDADVYLLTKARAEALKAGTPLKPELGPEIPPTPKPEELYPDTKTESQKETEKALKTIRITGAIPSEVWNRLGTKLLPKLKGGSDLRVGLNFSVDLDAATAEALQSELRQILSDLNLTSQLSIEVTEKRSD